VNETAAREFMSASFDPLANRPARRAKVI